MDFHFYQDPCEYIVIKNTYTEEEQNLIWKEINFFITNNLLEDNNKTGDPLASENKKGVVLDTYYDNNRDQSAILKLNRKIITENLKHNNIVSRFVLHSNNDSTYLACYKHGSFYRPHYDITGITAVTLFCNDPKLYLGGDLRFTEHDFSLMLEHNTTVIFPSFQIHEVTPVISNAEGYVRFTINQFYSTIPF